MKSIFPPSIQPPRPQKISHEISLHGDTRIDPYFWMRERDSAPVIEHLNAENAYYEAMTASWKPLQDQVFEEMKARVKEDDASPPVKRGPFSYYVRFEKGQEYAIYCRKSSSVSEEVLLDVNELAKGHKYTSVGGIDASPNHEWIAYPIDTVGRRFYDIHFKNTKTGATSPRSIPKTTGDFAWAEDNRTLFYTVQNPETLRAERVMRFDLETGASEEIFFEKDEVFSVGLSKSQSDRYIFIETTSYDSSEAYIIDAFKPLEPPTLFLAREEKHEYSIEDAEDGLFVLTNWQAENFRLMRAPLPQVSPTDHSPADKSLPLTADKSLWQEVVPHRTDTYLVGLLVLKNHLVFEERNSGLTRLEVIERSSMKSEFVAFPDAAYTVEIGSNGEYETDRFRYVYESLVRPRSVYDFFFSNSRSETIKVSEVPTYNSDLYTSERIWAKASDGTAVPISLVYKKGLRRDSTNPTLVYGYGSYGFSIDPDFRASVFSLLDRGFVYAIAHIRGGSEMGRAWYENGRMEHKKNTFTDFIAATEHLIREGYADPARVFASGGSAGGLLMGAISNLRPDLYKGIVSVVPFVDVLTTMLDADIPLTTAEYEQWGNPNEKKAYDYIKSYSPY
ncbi:MAG: S9 family peptidase, partial [Bdellovibrionales bacterium]|nr:S9 family peptidase [Bdellovibrionales bacterium]